MMSINRTWSRELSVAYISILLFMMAQYVVNERPWEHILRIAGMLAFITSMLLAVRMRSRSL